MEKLKHIRNLSDLDLAAPSRAHYCFPFSASREFVRAWRLQQPACFRWTKSSGSRSGPKWAPWPAVVRGQLTATYVSVLGSSVSFSVRGRGGSLSLSLLCYRRFAPNRVTRSYLGRVGDEARALEVEMCIICFLSFVFNFGACVFPFPPFLLLLLRASGASSRVLSMSLT